MATAAKDRARSPLFADLLIQGLGLVCSLVGGAILLAMASGDGWAMTAVVVYGLSLPAMFLCSILNALPATPRHKERWQALDHAAIFLLIAGTYTPFCLLVIGGGLGVGLLVALWLLAVAGMVGKILFRRHLQRARILIYVLMGWSGLVAIGPLAQHLTTPVAVLLLAGGLIYTLGAPMHRWERMPYHSALWHGCVLCAASLHWSAILIAVNATA